MATKITRPGDIKFLLLGIHQTQDVGCPTGSGTNNLLQRLPQNARTSLRCLFKAMGLLTDVADAKMLVKIRSLLNNFIDNFFSLKMNYI